MQRAPGVRLTVRLTPGAGRDKVEGVGPDGELRVRVAARPVEGAANRALVRVLATDLDVAPGRLAIVAGASGRRKIVEVVGLTRDQLGKRYPGLAL